MSALTSPPKARSRASSASDMLEHDDRKDLELDGVLNLDTGNALSPKLAIVDGVSGTSSSSRPAWSVYTEHDEGNV